MFIDQNNMKVQLSEAIPGFEVLSQILVYMRGETSAIAARMIQETDRCYFKVPVVSNAQKNTTEFDPGTIEPESYELIAISSSCIESIKDHLVNYAEKTLFAFEEPRESRLVIIP